MTGKVKWYNSKKGYGFIVQDSGDDIFLHASDLKENWTPAEGESVSFEKGRGPRGEKAINVEPTP